MMADLFATGIQVPNLLSGQARASDFDGVVRVYLKNNQWYGVDSNGNDFPIGDEGGGYPLLTSNGNGAPQLLAGKTATWTRTFFTSGSQVTIPVSKDGTTNGEPLFVGLNQGQCVITYSVGRDTDSNNEAPWAHMRQIGNNFFNLQVKKSNQGGVLLGGSYFGNLNNTNQVLINVSVTGILNEPI